ncbi:hypothetical protein [Nitrosomonas supralitoralis]|uniref:Uncharacterized protein n=1 Tax=Nitrosomonas supralitoralis TaxID=2116706 RepID=A0A2P7NR56_9PROT|nr:hypothetical protein [Nitrosomonas supralitoralis]PSJ15928.1 hypothetical protein C7H79_16345 [Nitrosomonas supralitoralis]
MNFTEYLFDKDVISDIIHERKKGLVANRGFSNLLSFGLSVIAERLAKDRLRYRDYGPYWWSLKDVMNANGYQLGDQSDPLVKSTYRGISDVETLIMADEFRSEYLKSEIIHSNKFMLDSESGEFWTLFDSDMEDPSKK